METTQVEQAINDAMPTIRDLALHMLRHTQISSWIWTICGALILILGIFVVVKAWRYNYSDHNDRPFVVLLCLLPLVAGLIAFTTNLPDALEPLGATVKAITHSK